MTPKLADPLLTTAGPVLLSALLLPVSAVALTTLLTDAVLLFQIFAVRVFVTNASLLENGPVISLIQELLDEPIPTVKLVVFTFATEETVAFSDAFPVVTLPPSVLLEAELLPVFEKAVTVFLIMASFTLFTVAVLVFVTEQVLLELGPVVLLVQLLPAAKAGTKVAASSAAAPTNVAIFFIFLFHLLSF